MVLQCTKMFSICDSRELEIAPFVACWQSPWDYHEIDRKSIFIASDYDIIITYLFLMSKNEGTDDSDINITVSH